MSNITIQEMSYYYTDHYHPVFENVSLVLDTDWKLGLIGRNGRGKTTLLKLLSKELEPVKGLIHIPGQISCFPYVCDETYTKTLDVIKENVGGLSTMERTMNSIIEEEDSERMDLYFELLETYQAMNGFEMESMIYREVEKMQLSSALLERDFATLSGGEKTSMMIISLFLRKEGFVLLDEPTNHLDMSRKEGLSKYLLQKKGFILVSHDTEFLNSCIDHILAINKADISLEHGNYETWKQNMMLKEEYELGVRAKLEREISQLERKSEQTRGWAAAGNTQKSPYRGNDRTNGARAYMGQAKRAEEKIFSNLEEKKTLLRNLEEERNLDIIQEMSGECLVEIDRLNYTYKGGDKELFKDFHLKIYPGDRIWLKGKNGSGKSTLLKLITKQIETENTRVAVRWAENIKIAYAEQEPQWLKKSIQEQLYEEMFCQHENEEESRLEYMLLYERFMKVCTSFDLPEDFINRPLATLSSGEVKKVDLARCLCGNHQLLILDEPLNFMDKNFCKQLEKAILKQKITVLFVEHNEEFGRKIANRILEIV